MLISTARGGLLLTMLLSAPAPSQGPRIEASAPRDTVTVRVEDASGARSREYPVTAITDAASDTMLRNGQPFRFTPLPSVLVAFGIAPTARVRISAAGAEGALTMDSGTADAYDPKDFGFIVNQQGALVLTPRPGTAPAASPTVSDWPQVRGVSRIDVERP